MGTETTKPRPSPGAIAWFFATVGLAVLAHFADLGTFINSDWSAEYSASISRILPPYIAACAVIAVLAVIIGLRRFPKHVAIITACATTLVLTGGFVQLKIIREAAVDRARVEEADMLADDIMSLRGVSSDHLEGEARIKLRKLVVRMYGEEMAGGMAYLNRGSAAANPADKEEAR